MDAGLIFIALGFVLGGILKGATGAGAPIVAIPVIALYYNVPIAVTVFLVPNFVANAWQIWTYRRDYLSPGFVARFVGAGVVGVAIGTMMLTSLPGAALKLIVAVTVTIYIAFRLLRPDWQLAFDRALRLAAPVGFVAGVLQGASGISAPVSITFLNAMRMERAQFIAIISAFFISMLVVQVPMLWGYGYLTIDRFLLSCAAAVILLCFMPVGAYLARLFSKEVFDRIILGVLGILALRLYAEVLL